MVKFSPLIQINRFLFVLLHLPLLAIHFLHFHPVYPHLYLLLFSVNPSYYPLLFILLFYCLCVYSSIFLPPPSFWLFFCIPSFSLPTHPVHFLSICPLLSLSYISFYPSSCISVYSSFCLF